MKRWLAKNGDRKRETDKAWQQANLAKIRIQRKKWKSRRYADRVAALVQDHTGTCDICGGPPDGRWKRLNIDHCHQTGQFRGLLCSKCNRALGLFKDNAEVMMRAIEYLRSRKMLPGEAVFGSAR